MDLKFRQEIMSPVFEKQHIEGLPFPAVLHHFTDIDRGDPHDHPFAFTSHILHGWYREDLFYLDQDTYGFETEKRSAGSSHRVKANTIHRITALSPGGCYTLITPEKWEKEPNFYRFQDGIAYVRQWNETEFKPLILK